MAEVWNRSGDRQDYRNRDITEDAEINQYLNGTLDDIPWKSLKDIDKAVEIISQKIDLGTRMRIIGDYDIDGVTATYILLKGFKRLGANVDTYIPTALQMDMEFIIIL